MAQLTQENFETKYDALRVKLASEGISEGQMDRAEYVEIYEDEENTCSDEWLSLFEDTARTQ